MCSSAGSNPDSSRRCPVATHRRSDESDASPGTGGLVLPVDTGKSAFGLRTCAESAPNVVHMARISGPLGVQVVTQDPRYRHSAVLAIRHGKLGEPGSPAAVVGSKTCR